MDKSEYKYNLDDWKTFILRELCKQNDASLINTICGRLKEAMSVSESDPKAHYLYTGLVVSECRDT